MRHLWIVPLLSTLLVPAQAAPMPAWRGVWEWSLPKRNEADLVRIADSAQSLGFNAIMMAPPQKLIGFMAEQCHQRGMKLYYSTVFAGGDKAWQQVMTPAEQERAKLPRAAEFMRGGEPVLAGELFDSPLPCYGRPEVHEFFRQKVIANAKLPVDGLAFDYAGYQNYRRCYCPSCEARLADFRQSHPGVSTARAEALVAEQILVEFTNDMAQAARQANPQLSLTIHIYPWFAPDPYYGHRTDIDYVGQTVAWFFRPHWPLSKVQRLTAALVRDQHTVYPRHTAAPFVGFDPRLPRDYRSSRRVGQEIEIIKQSGAEAMQFAELGYLLSKPLVAEAVARELGGSYRAARSE